MQTVPFNCQVLSISILASVAAIAADDVDVVDLRQAVIVAGDDGTVIRTAQRMLTEEVAQRTGITLRSSATSAGATTATILLCRVDRAPAHVREFVEAMNVPEHAEGFAIAIDSSGTAPNIVLAGREERGVLFAAGRLLLRLRMNSNQLELPAEYRIATAPRYPHRGHQIGFRNLSHCYDAWTAETYEQYMRELAVFGVWCKCIRNNFLLRSGSP
jgi:hypothetical protein